MKKTLITITLLITMAVVIKRVKKNPSKQVTNGWFDGTTLHAVIR